MGLCKIVCLPSIGVWNWLCMKGEEACYCHYMATSPCQSQMCYNSKLGDYTNTIQCTNHHKTSNLVSGCACDGSTL